MDEFLVNQTTPGNQSQPSVAGFRGTQFVAVWEDHSGETIKGRLFGVNGAPSDNEFTVNFPAPPGTKRQMPKVIETDQGFVVAWIERPPSGPAQLKLRTFDQDSLSGPESVVSTAEPELLIRPAMSRLADRGFAVVWADKRANERIRLQRFSLDGAKNGNELRANTTPGLHREPMVAGLTNGNIAVGWRARITGPLHLRLQILGPKGPVGGELIPNIEITDANMAPLDSGQFAIAHIRSAGDGEPGFETTVTQASVFEASGAFARRFPGTSATRILSSWPAIAPLSGGRFLVAWTEVNVDTPAAGTNVGARILSAQGPLGQAIRVNTQTGGNRFSLSAATTSGPDGDTAFFVWNDDTKTSADQSGQAVKGRMLTIPAKGF
ncbi:MAG: hypothetical protein E6G97_24415 [Alphaproteobacteria bacterium]|nr:MAG: hypothetical protein E6G97_24415 [Alphaproteobacteria bacterium]